MLELLTFKGKNNVESQRDTFQLIGVYNSKGL